MITSVRASAPASTQGTEATSNLLDQAALGKMRKNMDACIEAGWTAMPFVVDTFGAIRVDARQLISQFIWKKGIHFFPLTQAVAGRAIWSAVTAAAVARAAKEICRHQTIDRPAGLPTACLDLPTARRRSAIPVSLGRRSRTQQNLARPVTVAPAADELAVQPEPSRATVPVGSGLPNAHRDRMVDSEDSPCPPVQEALPVLVSCPDGHTIVVEMYVNDTVLVLQEAIHARVGVPPQQQRLIFAGKQLRPEALLRDYGVTRTSLVQLCMSVTGGGACAGPQVTSIVHVRATPLRGPAAEEGVTKAVARWPSREAAPTGAQTGGPCSLLTLVEVETAPMTPTTSPCPSPSPGCDPHSKAEEDAVAPTLDLLNVPSAAMMEVMLPESKVLGTDNAVGPLPAMKLESLPSGTGTSACPSPSPGSDPHAETEQGPTLGTLNGPTAAVMAILPKATGVQTDENAPAVPACPALHLPTMEGSARCSGRIDEAPSGPLGTPGQPAL